MISLLDLFKIGVGPSSSHTVGPMIATQRFANELETYLAGDLAQATRIQIELFGSLALTGLGHATDRAVVMGLEGRAPRDIDPAVVEPRFAAIVGAGSIRFNGHFPLEFHVARDLLFHRDQSLPRHPNGIRCTAFASTGSAILVRNYYSIGGGFVLGDEGGVEPNTRAHVPPFPFASCEELLRLCSRHNLSMAEVVHQNELSQMEEAELAENLDSVWNTMQECIKKGCHTTGTLPGGLGVKRRAPELYQKLSQPAKRTEIVDPLLQMDWVTMFALAVNEENAAGGRVVTAPTNGAAGVIPAVLAYYDRFMVGATRAGIHTFLETAGAIGMLYKRNASLSAAEMGCQGEVGVACSMAAAGLAAVMGGSPSQVENAAEIGMEHNLGLTCDPIAGLVQVPCIERNTMGAVKAINAARLAVLYGDGSHRVPLDRVIETMRQTGVDMQSKYKETSLGGLAVNVINC